MVALAMVLVAGAGVVDLHSGDLDPGCGPLDLPPTVVVRCLAGQGAAQDGQAGSGCHGRRCPFQRLGAMARVLPARGRDHAATSWDGATPCGTEQISPTTSRLPLLRRWGHGWPGRALPPSRLAMRGCSRPGSGGCRCAGCEVRAACWGFGSEARHQGAATRWLVSLPAFARSLRRCIDGSMVVWAAAACSDACQRHRGGVTGCGQAKVC